jgi:hypothetical protein
MHRVLRVTALATALLATPLLLWGDAAPRFRFREGQVLTYKTEQHGTQRDKSGELKSSLEGTIVLRVLKVKADGTADVKATVSGQGSILSAGEAVKLKGGAPREVVMTVRPDGSIVGLKTTRGARYTFASLWEEEEIAGRDAVLTGFAMSYALFGLNLPKQLPPAGGKWTGYQKQEQMKGSDLSDMSKMEFSLSQVPIAYTYKGSKKYQGRTCLVFAYTQTDMSGRSAPHTIYFDAAEGVIVGREMHLKKDGWVYDDVTRLVSKL